MYTNSVPVVEVSGGVIPKRFLEHHHTCICQDNKGPCPVNHTPIFGEPALESALELTDFSSNSADCSADRQTCGYVIVGRRPQLSGDGPYQTYAYILQGRVSHTF